MGIFAGPGVIEDGLVLALDAANQKSHNLTAVEVLVVAGGGGGGAGTAGGGGGGGLIYNTNFAVTPGSALTVTVGAGGSGKVYSVSNSAGDNGENSVFGSLTAIGGGGGGNRDSGQVGKNGGSGGGGGGSEGGINGAGTGTSGQGFAGGVGRGGGVGSAGGGGGGAGGVGQASPSTGLGGNGGPGLGFDISGTFTYYGGGGGGGSHTGRSSGGIGGGGAGSQNGPTYNAVAGTTNTGGGGGGGGGAAGGQYGGNGGSGIVIVRYPGPQKAIGGTVTSVNGYTIHTFTDVGSTTFTPLAATNNSAILGLSDLSGRNNFATSLNGPTYSSSNRGSIVFDGVDDRIIISYDTSLKPATAITMEAFCYIQNNGTSWASLIQYPQNSSSHIANYFDWSIYLGMPSRILHTRIDGETASSPGSVWNFDEWVYVAITFENQSVKYYVNGVSVGSSSISKTSITYDANNPVVIGTNAAGGEPFEGKLGYIKIYNRALTATEIQKNFNAQRGRFGI
jgi:hypothetical protein